MVDLNSNGVPNELSLGKVLDDLYMAPHEITALLSSWHQSLRGTPTESQALADHAAAISDPVTYNPDLANAPTPPASTAFVPQKHDFTFFGNDPAKVDAPTVEPTPSLTVTSPHDASAI